MNITIRRAITRRETIDSPPMINYDEALILSLYQKNGLQVRPPIRYGAWCGRQMFSDGQDIKVAVKA